MASPLSPLSPLPLPPKIGILLLSRRSNILRLFIFEKFSNLSYTRIFFKDIYIYCLVAGCKRVLFLRRFKFFPSHIYINLFFLYCCLISFFFIPLYRLSFKLSFSQYLFILIHPKSLFSIYFTLISAYYDEFCCFFVFLRCSIFIKSKNTLFFLFP